MNTGKAVFAQQILEHLPCYELYKYVREYNGNHRIKKFFCYDQFLCLGFAQITYRESLRDIETCLNSHHEKLPIELNYSLYAFDSTTIDLCRSLFP